MILHKRFLACVIMAGFLFVSLPAHADSNVFQRAITAIQGGKAQMMPPPASLEVAFSPDGGATDLVIKAVQSARQSIRVAAYSFTSRPIAHALIAAHKAGIDVEIVVDHDQLEHDSHSAAGMLAGAGIPVRVDIVHALLHDKYMVIDGRHVETGSFNYTAAAEQHNAENVLVLWDDPKLAAAYGRDWNALWDKAEAFSAH